jgi:hypothetical protein
MLSALGYMSKDILKFVVFFGVINVSFALGKLLSPFVHFRSFLKEQTSKMNVSL